MQNQTANATAKESQADRDKNKGGQNQAANETPVEAQTERKKGKGLQANEGRAERDKNKGSQSQVANATPVEAPADQKIKKGLQSQVTNAMTAESQAVKGKTKGSQSLENAHKPTPAEKFLAKQREIGEGLNNLIASIAAVTIRQNLEKVNLPRLFQTPTTRQQVKTRLTL